MITKPREWSVSARGSRRASRRYRFAALIRVARRSLLLILTPIVAFAQLTQPGSDTLTIPGGIPVLLQLAETISSAQAHRGDSLEFEVVNDVAVDGFTVIPAGSIASGSVVEVHRKHPFGLAGKLLLSIDSVKLASGDNIALHGKLEVKGRQHLVRMALGMFTVGLFYLPAAPVFLFSRGANAIALKDTEVTAHVDGNVEVDATGLARGSQAGSLNEMLEFLPPRVLDGRGNEGDMVNLVFIAAERDLQHAFQSAGWLKVDKSKPVIAWHLLVERMHYATLPMARFFLFGRAQDYSFALPDPEHIVARRHHLRIWRTDCSVHGTPVWVAAATYDSSIEIHAMRLGITHRIDPHVDGERDFVSKSLQDTRQVTHLEYLSIPHPVFEAQTAGGQPYYSDSRLALLDLSRAADAAASSDFAHDQPKAPPPRGGPSVATLPASR